MADSKVVEISELTRRNIIDELRLLEGSWSGRLTEIDFLSRIYDLKRLPSHDSRFTSMYYDIVQHTMNNYDWDDDWVFEDERLSILNGDDDVFLRFLCALLHPIVRSPEDVANLVTTFNNHLRLDGWEIVAGGSVSGRPVFKCRRLLRGQVQVLDSSPRLDVLSDAYIQELWEKCDARLASADLEGAITTGRTMLEAVLGELERKLMGSSNDYKGDLPRQFKQVAKLLRMDDQRQDLDERFKDVIRGLITIVHSLAPLRNKISDGHPRIRKPALHHAELIVNAAKTASHFLVGSYVYQRDEGVLGESGTTVISGVAQRSAAATGLTREG